MSRRDFNRWRPWMGYTLSGLCLFVAVATLVAGATEGSPLAIVAGIAAGIAALAFASIARR